MPVYHFNLADGVSVTDLDAWDLPGIDAAKREAVRMMGQLIVNEGSAFWDQGTLKMDVTDDRGARVVTLALTGKTYGN